MSDNDIRLNKHYDELDIKTIQCTRNEDFSIYNLNYKSNYQFAITLRKPQKLLHEKNSLYTSKFVVFLILI